MSSDKTPSLSDVRASQLLARYFEKQDQGEDVTPEEMCADCPDLLPTLHTMLDSLPPPPPATLTWPGAPPQVPGYDILGELGRGGMGVVYKARHLRLNRIVALKMILPGSHASPEQLVRFRSEAEAVARLQHPNIIQIHEIGEHQGQPFFSLEYCAGGSLAVHIRGTAFHPQQAAAIVETLARAMNLAHQQNIVHRDLKPANILVASGDWHKKDRKGSDSTTLRLPASGSAAGSQQSAAMTLKISDFGLAKQLDAEIRQTRTGAILGTPCYMAPEQARGDLKSIGVHTDIYALGAILYELLTTRPPFLAPVVMDTLHMVLNQEPVPPSHLQPKIPRDLETICLKCLQKEPSRRYASTEALAEDLLRFQKGESIVARPVRRAERTWKWVKRRPAVATLTGALLLAIVVGFIMVTWKWQDELAARGVAELKERDAIAARQQERRAKDLETIARRRAEDKEQEARLQRDLALKYFGKATDAVRQMLIEISEGNQLLRYEPRFEQVRKMLLEKALAYHLDFLREKSNDPTVRLATADVFRLVGDIHDQLGSKEEAEKAYLESVGLLHALCNEYGSPTYQQELGISCNHLALLLQKTSRLDAAEKRLRQALVLHQELVNHFPGVAAYRQELARSSSNLGVLLRDTGRPAEAQKLHQQAYDLRNQLVKDFPKVVDYRYDLARSCNNLGVLHWDHGELAEAEKMYAEAIPLYRGLAKEFPNNATYRQELAMSCSNLGVLLQRKELLPEAEKVYREGWTLRQELVSNFPSVGVYRQELAASCNNLANLLLRLEQLPEAEKLYRQAVDLNHKLSRDFPSVAGYRQDLAMTCNNLGVLLVQTLRLEDAEKQYREAYGLRAKLVEENPTVAAYREDLAQSCNNLGLLLQNTERLPEAETWFRKAYWYYQELAEQDAQPSQHLFQAAQSLYALADAQRTQNHWHQARATFEHAGKCFDRAAQLNPGGGSKKGALLAAEGLAECALELGDHVAAVDAAETMARLADKDAALLEAAAVLLARAIPLAVKDAALPLVQRQRLAKMYGEQAMAALKRAVAGGYREVDELHNEPAFAPLRQRQDFQALIRQLQEGK